MSEKNIERPVYDEIIERPKAILADDLDYVKEYNDTKLDEQLMSAVDTFKSDIEHSTNITPKKVKDARYINVCDLRKDDNRYLLKEINYSTGRVADGSIIMSYKLYGEQSAWGEDGPYTYYTVFDFDGRTSHEIGYGSLGSRFVHGKLTKIEIIFETGYSEVLPYDSFSYAAFGTCIYKAFVNEDGKKEWVMVDSKCDDTLESNVNGNRRQKVYLPVDIQLDGTTSDKITLYPPISAIWINGADLEGEDYKWCTNDYVQIYKIVGYIE